MFDSLARGLRRSGHPNNRQASSSTLPLYSPITDDTFDASSPTSSAADLALSEAAAAASSDHHHDLLKPAQRHALAAAAGAASSSPAWLGRPSLSRFLSDFTLGFADGLTVPFALTAGLSSLGQTDTVIYAGMAEICAGSISMGIGGYLGARGEASAAAAAAADRLEPEDDDDEEEEEEEVRAEDEKGGHAQAVGRYLAPLDLPPELLGLVRAHVGGRADVAAALGRRVPSPPPGGADGDGEGDEDDEDAPPPPVVSGLSVALGYLLGGSLPLFPYFAVGRVGDGLLWSFVVCVVALFCFGFVKDFVLHRQQRRRRQRRQEQQQQRAAAWAGDDKGLGLGGEGWGWRDVRRSAWEGAQMVILGSMAALAAVLCVRLFDGMGQGHDLPKP